MELSLNIYEKNKVRKVVKASSFDLMFGTVNRIMEIIPIDKLDDKAEIFKAIIKAWKEFTTLLFTVFPDLNEKDLDGIKVKELVPLLVDIGTFVLSETGIIPVSSKN